MSLLLRSVIKGLGWELGKTAAKEAVEELRAGSADDSARLQREAKTAKRDADRAARQAQKAKKKADKARAKEQKRLAREVDDELAALKRSIDL